MVALVAAPRLAIAHSPAPGLRSRAEWSRRMLGLGLGLLTSQALAAALLSPQVSTWAVGAMMCGCGVTMLVHERAARRLQAECTRASTLIQRGELTEARARLDHALTHARAAPHLHALLLFNRGVVDLRAGDLRAARDRLRRALDTGWFSRRGRLAGARPQVCMWMALLEALEGELDAARGWQAETRAALAEAPSTTQRVILAQQLAVDAVVELRDGAYTPALHRLENQRPGASEHLTDADLRLLDVLEAFAREHSATGQYRDRADELRLGGDRAREDEFTFLGASWPEMKNFLRRRGLTTPARGSIPAPS